MSDYARQNDGATHWGDRDARSTGDADKRVVGAHFDTEFDAILVAVNTKLDSTDYANTAAAQAQTATDKIVAPKSLEEWSDAGAGMLGDIWDLADPNADMVLGWDDSASAVIGFTFTDGLAFGDGVITLEHLGIEDLEDPGADRIMYWHDTASAMNWLTADNGIQIDSDDTIGLADVAVSSTLPVGRTSGSPIWDASSLTAMEGSALAATDIIIVENAGAPKQIAIQDLGLRIQTAQGTQNLAAADMNTIMKFTATSTLTIQENADADIPLGVPVVLVMDHADQELTVECEDGDITLESIFHPGGDVNESDVLRPGGMAVLVQTETDIWQLSGDIKDA